MRLLHLISNLLQNFFRKGWQEHELSEELDAYLEMLIERKIERGIDPAEARRLSLIELGGSEQVKERVREIRMGHYLETILQDLRYGVRMLAKSPVFTVVAVLSLALGIGANTAIFRVIDALILRELPVRSPDRLIAITYANGDNALNFSYPMFEKLRDGLPTSLFSSVSAVSQIWRSNVTVNSSGDVSEPEDALVGLVSGNYFSTLGVNTFIGRTLTMGDDRVPGGHPVTVISYDYWNRRFGLASNVVGSTVALNGVTYTVLGVTPAGFSGDWVGRSTDLWIPMAMEAQVYPERPDMLTSPIQGMVRIIAREDLGIAIKQSQAAADVVWRQAIIDSEPTLNLSWKQRYAQATFRVEPYARGYSPERDVFKQPLTLLMVVVLLVLLIACTNIASLLLARSAARGKEMAVRIALGASSGRIVRQLLTESLLLSLLGGVIGLLLAIWGTGALVKFLSSAPVNNGLGSLAIQLDVRPDARLLMFAVAAACLTGLFFGLVPAIRASKVSLSSALGGRGADSAASSSRFRLGKALVVSQVAVSLLLLIGAGLFLRTLHNLQSQDLGLDREHLLLVWTSPGQNGRKGPELANYYQTTQERISALPGVVSVSPSVRGLLRDSGYSVRVQVPGLTLDDSDSPHFDLVAPRFFETVGMRLLVGRDFDARDTEDAPHVAIINEYTAHLYFGDQNPIGKIFGAALMNRASPFLETEVVGVVKDARGSLAVRETDKRMIYFPYRQDLGLSTHPRLVEMCLAVRTTVDPERLKGEIRADLKRMDPTLPISAMESADEQLNESVAQERLIATLSACFGALAVLLSCLGLYGVISYTVERETNEIGIRMALGATRTKVLGMVLGESLFLIGAGIAIGLTAAIAGTRFISTMLFGISPVDPITMVAATLLMVAVAALAGFLPANRASRVDPMVALRSE